MAITADAGCYQLRAPTAWVDLEAAANAIDRAERALRASDLERAWSSATVAAGIAARPFLPGEDARWIAEVQGRLRAVRIRALTVLSDVHCRRGDHQLAVGHARALVALEPFREAGHRALMSAHLAAGDRGEAVRAYEQCRRLLSEQPGSTPPARPSRCTCGPCRRPEGHRSATARAGPSTRVPHGSKGAGPTAVGERAVAPGPGTG